MNAPRLVLIAVLAWVLMLNAKLSRRISHALARLCVGSLRLSEQPSAQKLTLVVDNALHDV